MKGEAQLSDFVDTVKEEMKLSEDTYDKRQRKIIELYGEFRDTIEKARTTFNEAVAEEPNRWYDRFPSEFRPETWAEGWKCGETRSGQIYREGWRLDKTLTLTDSPTNASVLLQFVHFLKDQDVVREGKLKFQLKWGGAGIMNYEIGSRIGSTKSCQNQTSHWKSMASKLRIEPPCSQKKCISSTLEDFPIAITKRCE